MALGDGVSAIAQLAVTFGGFSPTAMDGVEASKEMVERFEEIQRKRKEAKKRQRDLEFARVSREETFIDDQGNEWTYVLINDTFVRILSCDTTNAVVEFPSEINGWPVYALYAEVLSENNYIEQIICPDTIESIGACAFRRNANLRRVVLPKNVTEYDQSWLRHCQRLEELVLPDMLDKISLHVFDNSGLKKLHIGKNVVEIEPGAFQNTNLEEITVDADNPFIKTDGTGIYSCDGKRFLALARPVDCCEVAEGCEVLCKKSCYGIEGLKSVKLPATCKKLEPFAFSHSGLTSFVAHDSLRTVGEKAFYHCRDLKDVVLNEGLVELGDSAFEDSSIAKLVIPASIESIGNSITARTNVVHSGPGCSLSIAPGCEKFFLDGAGGLYRREKDGAHMVQLVDRDLEEYAIAEGTLAVNPYAFAYHGAIERVVIPDGVRTIGRSAFRVCGRLAHVELPDSLVTIGEEAFFDSNIVEIRIPAALQSLGKNALVTYGAHHGDKMPSLAHIEVAPENEQFFMKDGILCRRDASGTCLVIFTSSSERVEFPDDAYRVEEYAFNNARGIDYLRINPKVETIGNSGLTTWCWIRHIHVELSEPLEGRMVYDFFFPDTPKSLHGISIGIGGSSWVNVPGIMAQYDICIANARDYNVPHSPDNISAYEQAQLVIGRLKDPVLLTEFNRSVFERLLRTYIMEISVDIARHDDRGAFEELLQRGLINADNIDEVINRVNALQDAAMTAFLLETKRVRFSQRLFDFDL